MRSLILTIFAICVTGTSWADDSGITIKVKVINIPGAKGDLLVGLYNSPQSFTKSPMPQSPNIDLKSGNEVVATIPNVMPGKYAIAVIQDLNENGKLDKSMLGMPKEPLAFSVIEKIPKGKPNFEACAFEVGDKDIEMTISLVLK